MSTALAEPETEDLEKLLGKPPDCQLWLIKRGVFCGKPSLHHVKLTCPCGNQGLFFVCEDHLTEVRGGSVRCTGCSHYGRLCMDLVLDPAGWTYVIL